METACAHGMPRAAAYARALPARDCCFTDRAGPCAEQKSRFAPSRGSLWRSDNIEGCSPQEGLRSKETPNPIPADLSS